MSFVAELLRGRGAHRALTPTEARAEIVRLDSEVAAQAATITLLRIDNGDLQQQLDQAIDGQRQATTEATRLRAELAAVRAQLANQRAVSDLPSLVDTVPSAVPLVGRFEAGPVVRLGARNNPAHVPAWAKQNDAA